MTEQITVLIVDDHQVVRQGVRTFLEAQADIDDPDENIELKD